MEIVTKQATAVVAPVEDEHPNGSFEVILSTETLDRDKEHLWASEWKQPLPDKIHFDGDHGRSLDKTVGSAVPRFEGNKLVAKGTFAGTPYAQMVRQLVNEGHVNTVSVTYSETKNQKDNSIQRELLNAAFVAIPANPEAVVLSSKSVSTPDFTPLFEADLRKYFKGDEAKVKQIMDFVKKTSSDLASKAEGGSDASGNNPTVKHDDMVQAIHDAAIHLGAQCLDYIDADPGTADGANKNATGYVWNGQPVHNIEEKSSSPDGDGSPLESAEESAAAETAEKSAVSAAADDSADDTAHTKAKEAEKARALAFLISQNTKEI